MNKLKLLAILISPLVLLTGCMGGGGDFDVAAFVRNPVIMFIVFVATLYIAFKMTRGK